uniref:Uncharacterized protein n=1 Tax=Caenorhabditis japonica TaxID=281687 RepID=A0A8R1DI94_CAEJA
MTKQVAWHLATVPKMFKHPLQYHEIISKQFFETIWSQNVVDKNLLAVFAGYVEELRIRFSLNCDLTVFDQILRFWEILNKKIIEEKSPNSSRVIDFAPNHVRNLQLLSQILPSADSKRIRACFTCFFACVEEIPHIKDILKASFETVGNLGYSLYQYVMTPSQPVAIVKKRAETSSKIQEIGEKEEEPFDEMWLHGIGDADQSVAMRLEKVLFIVDNILSQSLNRTILEMMSFGLEEFLKTSEKEREEDTARFVQLDSAKMFSSFHAHLLVGCCFERLINIAEKTGFSPEECLQLLQISIQILNNASAKFNRLTVRRRSVDVFSLTEEEKKEIEATRATAKMCFPIVSTILLLTQGSRGLHDYHVKAVEAMANFIKAADTFPTDDHSFNSTVEEARNLLKDLKIDISQISAPPVPSRGDKRRYSQVDICQELMEELHDDEPAVKGGTLMQIAKVFRQRSVICNRLIEYGGFEVAK